MVFGLLLLIIINGLGYFWTSDIVELTLKDGQHVMGQLAGREVIPRSSPRTVQKEKAAYGSRSGIAIYTGLISNGSTTIRLCRSSLSDRCGAPGTARMGQHVCQDQGGVQWRDTSGGRE